MNTNETPLATAMLWRGRKVWQWRACCPYCRRTHYHYGGPVIGVPIGGNRAARCGRGRYRLALVVGTEADDAAKKAEGKAAWKNVLLGK